MPKSPRKPKLKAEKLPTSRSAISSMTHELKNELQGVSLFKEMTLQIHEQTSGLNLYGDQDHLGLTSEDLHIYPRSNDVYLTQGNNVYLPYASSETALGQAFTPAVLNSFSSTIHGIGEQIQALDAHIISPNLDALIYKTDRSVVIYPDESELDERAITSTDFDNLAQSVSLISTQQSTTLAGVEVVKKGIETMKNYLETLSNVIQNADIYCIACNRLMARVKLIFYGSMPCPECHKYLEVPSEKVRIDLIEPKR